MTTSTYADGGYSSLCTSDSSIRCFLSSYGHIDSHVPFEEDEEEIEEVAAEEEEEEEKEEEEDDDEEEEKEE